MRVSLLFISFVLVKFSALAQSDNKIVIGKIDSVYSKILQEPRKVWIYTPDMTSGNREPGKRYPVLYLLDGDAHFPSVMGLVQQLSQVNGNTILPEMIIVGIPNTDRTRDLTPTHVTNDPPFMDSSFSKTSGGGENFLAFMEKELMPHVDSLYPAAPYRVLVGHSFGGLIVLAALTNHTNLFNAHIAIDPSMWYDRERFLAAVEKKLTEKKYNGVRLYVGIANTMSDGMTLTKLKKDTSVETRHIRSIFALDRFVKAHPQNGLLYASRYYNNDDHGSVPLASEYDGLRFIFDYYRVPLTMNDFTDSSDTFVNKLKKHYTTVSKNIGFAVSPPELFINSLGYEAISKKWYKRAAALFTMNIANYPASSNVYDSYGDLLVEVKDTLQAKAAYQKALALKDNAFTRQKLNVLEGKEAFKLSTPELQKYAGVYVMDSIGITITMQVKDSALWAEVPGDGNFQLVPFSTDTFTLKNMSGYEVRFHTEGDKMVGFTSVQPNGTFKARLKK
jgi:hypothetical protein